MRTSKGSTPSKGSPRGTSKNVSTAEFEALSASIDSRELLRVLAGVKKGDFSVRLPVDRTGIAGKIADTFNDVVELNERMARELERISTVVGKEGRISQRAHASPAPCGAWADCVESVNTLIGDLVQPTTEMARVIGAVAKGDLSQTMALEVDGRPLQGRVPAHRARPSTRWWTSSARSPPK